MYVLQCCWQADKTETAEYVRGEGFLYPHDGAAVGVEGLEQGGHEFFDAARCESFLFHTLGGMIVGLHAHLAQHEGFGTVYVGMTYVDTSVESGGFAEYNVIGVEFYCPQDILDAGKPDAIYPSVTVGEMAYESCLASLAYLLEAGKLAFELYKGHIGRQLGCLVESAAVDVFVGKEI